MLFFLFHSLYKEPKLMTLENFIQLSLINVLQLIPVQINEEILQRVAMMGFNKNFLIQSLHERIHNDVCKCLADVNQ